MLKDSVKTDGVIDDHARRRFLKMIGAGTVLAATGVHAHAQSLGDSLSGRWDPDRFQWRDWARIRYRNAFILNPQKLFMNIGTAGSMPREVVRFFNDANTEYARESLNGYGNFAALRAQIAPGFGVDPDELVVSYNTSDGMCHAILGIPWQAGDCVVTTNHEHPGGNVPLQIAVDRYGIEVRRIQCPTGNDQTAEEYEFLFQEAIDQARADGLNVRAMMWSSPTFLTGTMLPIRRLVDVAIKNELISICDGAHLPGMMAYDYAALGVDFMSGAGHKWQCGPGSTGILIIRNKIRSEYNQLPLPAYFPVTTSSYSTNRPRTDGSPGTVAWTERATGPVATYDIAAVIQSCGSKHSPMLNALGKACAMWDEIGRDVIEEYILSLSMRLKDNIASRWGVQALYAPMDDPELVSALTSFNPFFYNPELITDAAASGMFVNRLRDEYGIIVRNTAVPVIGSSSLHRPIRVSTHLWHSVREVDRLVDACWDLADKMSRNL